ncbi:MAG: Holliday junction resolvase RuvX [Christensenella sp.]|nr:Holliday junction resolvase RuvX [Christensenella sp.]
MRHLSIDLGEVRIGLAMSDSMGIIANGLETYQRKYIYKDIEYIAKLAMDNLVKCVVIGLPINMNGTRGERVEKSEQFASMLNDKFKELNYECKIDFQDERLTTVSSERVLIEAGVRRENRKKVIDKMAATIILQTYLDCHVGR